MKVSFITTIYNEEKTIEQFLKSLLSQTKLPNEVIIVDGGSTDATVERFKIYDLRFKKKKVKFNVLIKRGNRSVGRNEAIKHATGDVIVCTDAGNILDKDWIKNITKPFISQNSSSRKSSSPVDVVAGYYKGKAKNVFQKCLIPYVLVMPDKVNPNEFLPATRSVAFTKQIWKKVGGFDEQLSHNEDYVFAQKLKDKKAKIVFAKDAIVNWIPRNTFKEAFTMFWRFAFGDAEAGIWRTSVLLLFTRYFLGFYFIFLSLLYKSFMPLVILIIAFAAYIFWSIKKNYHYVNQKQARVILPLLQFTADVAVFLGTIVGGIKKITKFHYLRYIQQNKFLLFISSVYTFLVLLTLGWGVPNQHHPFPYHMDEWHQLMAIKAIIREGTTTIEGAAQIPFVYPVLSGIYLLPFVAFNIIDPFSIKTPFDNLLIQGRLFEILRSVNIFFGIGSIFFLAKIAKKYLRIDSSMPVFFFTLSPIFVMLSGYFKYDIGLLFFIILSLLTLFKFGEEPTLRNYLIASFISSLAFSVKFSAIPLLPLLLFAPFWFVPKGKNILKWIFMGAFCYIATFILVGSPNILFGTADYRELLYSNLVSVQDASANYTFGIPGWLYLLVKQYPLIFGHVFYYFSLGAFIYLFYRLSFNKKWELNKKKNIIFLLIAFLLFAISLITLKIGAVGNRMLVLLPFFALMTGLAISILSKNSMRSYKYLFSLLVIALCVFHLFESVSWIYTKIVSDPQKQSSTWIEKHIDKGSVIGIENIPIYQGLPNIVVKEFYSHQYNVNYTNIYNHKVIDCTSRELPNFVVISNGDIENQILKQSPKKCLIKRLDADGYQKIVNFTPDFMLYKLFASTEDYFLSGLITAPRTVSIFKKN